MNKWFVLSIIIFAVILYAGQIVIYSANIPFWDDYDAVLDFLNEFKSNSNFSDRIDLLLSQHNEHRIFLDRLLALGDYLLFGQVNFMHLIYVGNSFVVLLLVLVIGTSLPIIQKRKEPWKWLLLLPIPFFMLNMQSWENFLWAMASIQNLGVVFFTFLCFYFLFFKPLIPSRFAFGILCASIATYTSGNGMLCLAIGLFVMLITRKKPIYIIIWILSSGLLLYAYLHDFHPAPGHPDPFNTLRNETGNMVLYFFTLLSSGWEVFGYKMGVYLTVGLVFLVAVVILVRENLILKNPLLFSILLFLVLTCCLISVSRTGFGVMQALDMRYRNSSLLLFMFTYLALLAVQEDNTFTSKQQIPIWIFIVLSAINYLMALEKYHRPMSDARSKLIHGLAAYNENNRYSYLAYPIESKARKIISASDSLETYLNNLTYKEIASRKVHLNIEATNNIDYGFGIEIRDDYLFVDNGWAYIEGLDANDTDRFVVLKSDSVELMFDSYWHTRPDVTVAKNAGNLDRSGFSCIILKDQIPNGIYRVGILIRKAKQFWQADYLAFEFTDMILVKNRAGAFMGTSTMGLDSQLGDTNYYVDELNVAKDSISLRGWAIIHGISSEDVAINITFRSEDGDQIRLAPNLELRPDVAQALHGDYAEAGFILRLSRGKLKPSTYQIVITLTYSGQDKNIEIDDRLEIEE